MEGEQDTTVETLRAQAAAIRERFPGVAGTLLDRAADEIELAQTRDHRALSTLLKIVAAARVVDALVSADGPPFKLDGRALTADAEVAFLILHDELNTLEAERTGVTDWRESDVVKRARAMLTDEAASLGPAREWVEVLRGVLDERDVLGVWVQSYLDADHADGLMREAVEALVDVMPYLHPNPNSPRAEEWAARKEAALDKAAKALDARPPVSDPAPA